MGVGLNEPDLLRPLREFVTERQHHARERPLFAVLARPSDGEAYELRRFLYARYGVKVWYYDQPEENDRTASFCTGVEKLADARSAWWAGWQMKPAVRRPVFHIVPRNGLMAHHYTKPSAPADPYDEEQVANVLRAAIPGPGNSLRSNRGVGLVLLGRAGTGKGSLGVRLAQGDVKGIPSDDYRRRFFATMHFTNEFLSTIESAAEHLAPGSRCPGDHFARLEEALVHGEHLLVLGGIERLLVAATAAEVEASVFPLASTEGDGQRQVDMRQHPLEVGRPMSREVMRLFELVGKVAAAGQSHVVLTSSVRPILPAEIRLEMLRLRGTSEKALKEWGGYETLKDDTLISQLHHALRGHSYALAVLERVLARNTSANVRRWLAGLLTRLSAADLSRRAELAIEAAIQDLVSATKRDSDSRWPHACPETLLGVLQRLSLFATPATATDVALSWPIADDGAPPQLPSTDRSKLDAKITEAIRRLTDAKLLLVVEGPRFTAHTLVRQYVLHTLGKRIGDIPGELNRLQLGAFSAEASVPPVPPPRTAAGHLFVTRSVDQLIEALEERVWLDEKDPRYEAERASRRQLVRAIVGLMRSRWSANTVPQEANVPEIASAYPRPHYDSYHRRLVRVLNAIRIIHQLGNKLFYKETDDPAVVGNPDAFLYADELAWLYNEVGMVSYAQGSAHDAYAIFRIGQDINAVAERQTRGPRWCQSEINLAGVHIETANLPRARYHLDNALVGAVERGDDEIRARVYGYHALVQHLSGNYHAAQDLYEKALDMLKRQGNRRALSIFLRHRGDLLRKQQQLDEAAADIRASLVAAESGGHLDLVQYARVAEANLRRRSGDFAAQEVLSPALEFARKVGIPKLEADALKVQAHLALAHDETELAARLGIASLGIAAAHGMRLRVTAGLVLMGHVACVRGERSAAKSLLTSAIDLGHLQGYQLQVEEADRQLMHLASFTRVTRFRDPYSQSTR